MAAVTNAAGVLVDEYEYTPYGELVSGGAVWNPFQFAGRRMDESTGLYHMRARSYIPGMGRFLSRDQIGLWGDANNWGNAYLYGGNNPFAGSDPTGNEFEIPEPVSRYGNCMPCHSGGKPAGHGDPRGVPDLSAAVAGVADGAITGVTLGFVETTVTADLFGVDTESIEYQAGNIAGDIVASAAMGAFTGGTSAAVQAGLRVGRIASEANGIYQTGVGLVQAANSEQGITLGDMAFAAGGLAGVGGRRSRKPGNLLNGSVDSTAPRGGGGTEVVERAMSRAELDATRATGLVRGGRDGPHFVSDAVNNNANRARQRLALPQTPEVKVQLEVPKGSFGPPSRVGPANGMPGGGMERTGTGQIPATVRGVRDL